MPLTDTSIKAAIKEANDSKTETKKFDEGGLYLLLKLRGGKCRTWWRLKYRFGGKERGLSLGVYPTVTLKRAREKRDEAKALLADGVDPSEQRKANKLSQALTFQLIAEEWLQLQSKKLSKATMTKSRWLLDDFLAPAIGSRPIAQLGASDILPALRKIEARGTHETAHRAKQLAGRIFRYAVATGRTDRDPTADLRGALAPVVTESHAAITDPTQIGQLLRAIDGYQGQPATGAALKLAPIFFVRPGELRGAEWSEFDLTVSKTWRIPGPRMKMGEPHLVPLPTQAITVLQSLQAITGEGRFLFPSIRTPQRPMSENTINAALRRLGYSGDEMTGHGFRALASTCLNEQGFPPDVIELQLAHAERNKVRAAYNRAQRLEERRKMMQSWADYLDGLKTGSNVAPIGRAGGV